VNAVSFGLDKCCIADTRNIPPYCFQIRQDIKNCTQNTAVVDWMDRDISLWFPRWKNGEEINGVGTKYSQWWWGNSSENKILDSKAFL